MKNIDVNVLPVIDKHKVFVGFIWLPRVLEAEKKNKTTIAEYITNECPSVYKEYTVEEMLPLITGTKSPIAVVDKENGKLLGVVSQTSLVIEATRFNKEEIVELKEQAKEQ
jgi:glycine betaine/proline transport system ATP-binding protein